MKNKNIILLRYIKKNLMLLYLIFSHSIFYAQTNWNPTNSFPNGQVLKTLCLAKDFGWGNITVGGEVTQRNIFTSTDDGNSWTNLGPHPSGVIYAIAQEQSVLGTKYCVIRDPQNSSNNGIYRRHNTYGWQLIACQGLDVRCVIQRYGTVLAGCRNAGRGIYRSTNDGNSWIQIYNGADIYCFDAKNNTMYAGGCYTSGAGILLKSSGFPFDNWLEVGYFDGYVIGVWVTESGNIWVATHHNKIYRSISGGSFNIVKSDVNWDELKIPITSNSSNQVFVGDYQTGVWYTNDNGASWQQHNSGLPNLHITDLAIDPINQIELYATLGNSLSSHIYSLGGLVPVELTTLHGIFDLENSIVYLEWQTASEMNNYGFEVERAILSEWKVIGFVKGNGTTSVPQNYSFRDNLNNSIEQLYENSTALKYRLKQIDFDGTFEYSPEIEVMINQNPLNFRLSQNYPNPFNPATKIRFEIPESAHVKLTVYDVLGREITTIINEELKPGRYEFSWDASKYASGVYFYKIEAGSYVKTMKMLLIQ